MSQHPEIIVAPYTVWIAAVGTTFPALDAEPAEAWQLLGTNGARSYAGSGVAMQHGQQWASSSPPAGQTASTAAMLEGEDLRIRLELLDLTLEQYSQAMGANTVVTVPAGPGTIGYRKMGLSIGPRSAQEFALLVRGPSPYADEMPAQYELPRACEVGSPQLVFGGGGPARLAIEYKALPNPSATSEDERFGRLLAQNAGALPPAFDPLPIITSDGTPQVGDTLTGVNGTVTGGTVTGISWRRNGSTLVGATGQNYTLTQDDLDAIITFTNVATGAGGTTTAVSNGVGPIVPAAPVFSENPSATGTARVGQTLTGVNGTVIGGTITSVSWRRNGSTIMGATGQTYTVTEDDLGAIITFANTATGAGGTATAVSAGLGPIVAADVPISAVSSNGWMATIADPGAFIGPVSFTVSRGGFDSNGDATTYTETVKLTSRVFNAYTTESGYGDATFSADSGSLSDFIYATDTIPGITLTGLPDSPKVVMQWQVVDKQLVGNTMTLEVKANHRDGVACVEARVSDGTTTVTAKSSTPVISPKSTDANPVIVYRFVIDISTLSDPSALTVDAKGWPRLGGAASITDSADLADTVANRRLFAPRTYRRDTTLAAAPNVVYVVDSATGGGSTTPYVGPDEALALASPATTELAAFNRAVTVLGDIGGLRIKLLGKSVPVGNTPTSFPATTPTTEVIIEPAPGVSKAAAIVEWGAAAAAFRIPFVRYRGLTVNRVGSAGSFAAANGNTVFEDCIFNNSGVTSALGTNTGSGVYWDGTVITGTAGSVLQAGTNLQQRMMRGCTVTVQTAGTNVAAELFNAHGNVFDDIRDNNAANRNQSGLTRSSNIFRRLRSPLEALNSGGDIVGACIENNVIEYVSSVSGTAIAISADSAANNTTHVIHVHNTYAGFFNWGRGNLFYNETANVFRTHTMQRDWGNIYVSLNTKHDFFAGLTGVAGNPTLRTGGWSYLYGTGSGYNFVRYIDAGGGTWAQHYAGEGTVIGTTNTGAGLDPLFTNYQAANDNGSGGANAGTGGGGYTLQSGSPARDFAPVKPWTPKFGIDGTERTGTIQAGALAA